MNLHKICEDVLTSHKEHTKIALYNLEFKRFANVKELENTIKKIVENVPFEIGTQINELKGDYLFNLEIRYAQNYLLFEIYYLLDNSGNILITEINQ